MIDIKKYELSTTGIDTCKGKLVPGVVATWGEIVGDIANQQDLVDYVESHGGGGVGSWGEITGDIQDQTDLITLLGSYATLDLLSEAVEKIDTVTIPNALEGYATEIWVENKGYLVQSDLSQYATRQWVTGRGYATQDWVSQQGYASGSDLSSLESRVETLETNYADAIDITNDILGI